MKFKRNPKTDIIDAIQIPVDITIIHKNGKRCDVCKGDWFGIDVTSSIKIFKDEVFKKAFLPCEVTDSDENYISRTIVHEK